jgi:DeoR family glycerol-3-phosphate regulon repressor
MLERSDRAVLLVDSSKYDLVQFERVCALADIDQLVCEAAPPKRLAASLKGAGVEVIVAKE